MFMYDAICLLKANDIIPVIPTTRLYIVDNLLFSIIITPKKRRLPKRAAFTR